MCAFDPTRRSRSRPFEQYPFARRPRLVLTPKSCCRHLLRHVIEDIFLCASFLFDDGGSAFSILILLLVAALSILILLLASVLLLLLLIWMLVSVLLTLKLLLVSGLSFSTLLLMLSILMLPQVSTLVSGLLVSLFASAFLALTLSVSLFLIQISMMLISMILLRCLVSILWRKLSLVSLIVILCVSAWSMMTCWLFVLSMTMFPSVCVSSLTCHVYALIV
mmetsp:Transcript_51946/g.77597  ORF Transcript_51946/g.77597 Transcript_51946/m.77597 type:complete len:221 (-) Transcript_51946:606-1268(-)